MFQTIACYLLEEKKRLRHSADFGVFGPTQKLWTWNIRFMDLEYGFRISIQGILRGTGTYKYCNLNSPPYLN